MGSLMWFAGLIETVVGVVIILGVFTTLAAFIGAVEMLVAYLIIHAPQGFLNPLTNKGELALLYFAAFLVLMVYGPGKWSLGK